jgi:hypothetical protein
MMGTACMAEDRIAHGIAETLRDIERVEGIYLVAQGDVLGVFTIIDDDDEDTYDLIYSRERRLIRRFGGVQFDFNVIARRGRSISEIVGRSAPIWRRSGADHQCLNVPST